VDGRDGFQVCEVAAVMSRKQLWPAIRGWFSSFWVGWGGQQHCTINSILWNVAQGLGLGWIPCCWHKQQEKETCNVKCLYRASSLKLTARKWSQLKER